MSDSFNAHELLSKLRAKSSNSTAASVVSEPPKRGNVVPDFDQKPSPVKTPAAVTTNIRAPISLTLTPSQRQENLNARLELEREIKRLQDEVTSLLSENLQLKQDKEDVEQQFIEFRTKSEKTIIDLRGRIAANTLHNDTQPDRGTGTGRLYGQRSNDPQSGSKLSTSQLRSPCMKSSNKHFTTPQSGSHSQHHHNNSSSWYDDNNSIPPPPPSSSLSNTHPQSGFRDPTFSELMRRSTPEHHDFRTALRRENNTKLGTGLTSAPAPLPAHTHQSPHFSQSGGSSQHAGSVSAQHTGPTAHGVSSHSGGGSGHVQHGLHMSGHSQQSHQLQQHASHGHSHNTTTSSSNVPHTHSNSTGQRTKSVPNMSMGLGNQQYHYTDGPHGESKTNSANTAHSGSESHRHSAAASDMEHFMTANTHHHPGGNLGMSHLTTGTHNTNSNNNGTVQGNSNTAATATAGNSSNHHHANHHGIVRTVDNCSDEDDDLPVLEIDLSA